MTNPTIGRIVIYKLDQHDVNNVNGARKKYEEHCLASGIHPHESVFKGPMGNTVELGDEFPAMIVSCWGKENTSSVNLRVFLDGNDTFWAMSKIQNDDGIPGSYRFPQVNSGFTEAKAAPSNPVPVAAPAASHSRPNLSPSKARAAKPDTNVASGVTTSDAPKE